jgi:hypothetical protein
MVLESAEDQAHGHLTPEIKTASDYWSRPSFSAARQSPLYFFCEFVK